MKLKLLQKMFEIPLAGNDSAVDAVAKSRDPRLPLKVPRNLQGLRLEAQKNHYKESVEYSSLNEHCTN